MVGGFEECEMHKLRELTWNESDRLFRDKYLLEIYYDNKAKAFYELKMGHQID